MEKIEGCALWSESWKARAIDFAFAVSLHSLAEQGPIALSPFAVMRGRECLETRAFLCCTSSGMAAQFGSIPTAYVACNVGCM